MIVTIRAGYWVTNFWPKEPWISGRKALKPREQQVWRPKWGNKLGMFEEQKERGRKIEDKGEGKNITLDVLGHIRSLGFILSP